MLKLYQKLIDKLVSTRRGARTLSRVAAVVDRRIIKWSGGRITSGIGTKYGKNILLLTCMGAKTGKERVVPVFFTAHGDDVIVVASQGGAPGNPSWYHNLKKTPACSVAIHGKRTERVARRVTGEERARLWKVAAANYAGYDNYQAWVKREIPVMLLERPAR